jgi:hypothetical protein
MPTNRSLLCVHLKWDLAQWRIRVQRQGTRFLDKVTKTHRNQPNAERPTDVAQSNGQRMCLERDVSEELNVERQVSLDSRRVCVYRNG